MKLDQVALQLFTLREFVKTPADIATTLKRVKDIGYTAVQASALGPIEDAELRQLCEDNGLVIAATHESGEAILNRPEEVIQKLENLGCKHTAYPYPGGIDFADPASVNGLLTGLDKAAKAFAAAGKTLSYHNHQIEFLRPDNGPTVLERIFDETSIAGEIDTYWIQYGGGNPVEWCEKLAGRLPVIHLKDFGINADREILMKEIGYGSLDFKKICAAAEKSGCKWFVVEQDRCERDPFESAAMSFEYIKANLVD